LIQDHGLMTRRAKRSVALFTPDFQAPQLIFSCHASA
jgi:hypothetical protein